VEQIAVSPRGDRFATAAGRTARLWTSRGEPIFETEPHASTVTAIAFGAKSDQLATCCYGGVHVWTIREAAVARHLAWKGSLIALAWSATGKIIACASQDNSVHFWRLPSGADSEMTGYPFKPKALSFDAHGKLLATSGDAQICCWDFTGRGPEGSAPIVLDAHRAQVTQLAFHPRRGLLASAAQDTGVIVWEPRKGTKPVRYGFSEDAASGLAWSPDGAHLAVVDGSGRAIVYRTASI
jgi:WD40 repeat protein